MFRLILPPSAPGSRKNELNGIEETEIRLGIIQPQDFDSTAVFNDALTKLKANLYYLYSRNTRLWFGVTPTLRKIVDDKREQFSDDDIESAIKARLEKWKGRGLFKAVHICPKTPAGVADEQIARLVILAPKYVFDNRQPVNPALDFAEKILNSRGTGYRKNKNTLLFLAADSDKLSVLKKAVREFKAWTDVIAEADLHNLDRIQIVDAKSNRDSAEKDFAVKISQTYRRLFAPDNFEEADMIAPKWFFAEIDCTNEDNISAASEKFSNGEMLLNSLGHEKLKKLLDKFIWRESNSVKLDKLWEYFTEYYYMPRLVDENVLLDTVRKGVAAKTFALSDDKDLTHEIKFGDISISEISSESFLVKSSFAQKLLDEKIQRDKPDKTSSKVPPNIIEPKPPIEPPIKSPPKHFSMDVELDNTRLTKSFDVCIDEIVSHLMNLPNVSASIRLAVNISAPEGISEELQEIVSGNCRFFKIENFYFED